MLALLLEHKADANLADNEGLTPLHKLARSGFATLCRILLKAKADPLAKDKHNRQPIQYAARTNEATIRALLDFKANVNVAGSDWPSPIVYAASEANLEVLKLLLDSGADAKSEDPENPGWTALHAACKRSNPDRAFAELLIEHEADVNAVTKISKTTPLHNAVNSAAVVQLLLRGGAKVDPRDSDGKTPLMLACENANSARVVEILIAAGADLNAEDNVGFTPLIYCAIHAHPGAASYLLQTSKVKIHHDETSTKTNACMFAARHGSIEIVKLLINHDASIVLRVNKHKDTALHEACRSGHLSIVKLILETDASNIVSVNDRHSTAFDEAAEGGHIDIVAFMMNQDGVDPLHITRRNCIPLFWAAWTGKQDLVELLMAVEGTDLRHQSTGGWTLFTIAASAGLEDLCRTLINRGIADSIVPILAGGVFPLHCATQSNRPGIVELLLAQPGVDKNARSNKGYTPLWLAVRDGKAKSVMALLAHHVDVDTPDDRGRTPLLIATQGYDMEIVQMLLNGGATQQLDEALEFVLGDGLGLLEQLLREVGAVEHDEGFGLEELMAESSYQAPMDQEMQATSGAENIEEI
ncbi:hypothetical protein KCU71_g8185, partial [Aureobasidium melanogenum]